MLNSMNGTECSRVLLTFKSILGKLHNDEIKSTCVLRKFRFWKTVQSGRWYEYRQHYEVEKMIFSDVVEEPSWSIKNNVILFGLWTQNITFEGKKMKFHGNTSRMFLKILLLKIFTSFWGVLKPSFGNSFNVIH